MEKSHQSMRAKLQPTECEQASWARYTVDTGLLIVIPDRPVICLKNCSLKTMARVLAHHGLGEINVLVDRLTGCMTFTIDRNPFTGTITCSTEGPLDAS